MNCASPMLMSHELAAGWSRQRPIHHRRMQTTQDVTVANAGGSQLHYGIAAATAQQSSDRVPWGSSSGSNKVSVAEPAPGRGDWGGGRLRQEVECCAFAIRVLHSFKKISLCMHSTTFNCESSTVDESQSLRHSEMSSIREMTHLTKRSTAFCRRIVARHLCLARMKLPAEPPVCAAPGRPGNAAPAGARPPPTLPAAPLPRTPGKLLRLRWDPWRGMLPGGAYRQLVQPLSDQ